jgi:hypothetical protein
MFRAWRVWDESAPGVDDIGRAGNYRKKHPDIVRHALYPEPKFQWLPSRSGDSMAFLSE